MSKRYAVLGMSVFLALALSVPALGGPSNPVASTSATAKALAKKALRKANRAQRTANQANGKANQALSNAASAQSTANGAQNSADNAQQAANAAQADANAAQTAADNANANANNRVASSRIELGAANPTSGTNTTGSKSASAACDSGEVILGGGYFVGGNSEGITVVSNQPLFLYSTGWTVTGEEIPFAGNNPSWSIAARLMCGTK
jgi:hypothetical protein